MSLHEKRIIENKLQLVFIYHTGETYSKISLWFDLIISFVVLIQVLNFTDVMVFSWRDVFVDNESGVAYYMWGVGSEKGQDDVFQFIRTEQDCAVSTKHNAFDILEGHSYFLTVKVAYQLLQ